MLTRCLRPASGHCSKCCRLQKRARHRGGRDSPEHKAPSVLPRGGWCHCPHPGARLAAPGDGVGRDPALRAQLLPHGVGQSCSLPFSPRCPCGCWPKPTGNPSATPLHPISQPLAPQGCPVPPLQTTQPGTGRNQVLFLAPPTDGSQHARPFPQQQALPPLRGQEGSWGYLTAAGVRPFAHTTGVALFRVHTDGTPRTPRALQHRHRDTHTATLGAGGHGGAAAGGQHGDGGELRLLVGWKGQGTQDTVPLPWGWSLLPDATRGCDTEGQSPPAAPQNPAPAAWSWPGTGGAEQMGQGCTRLPPHLTPSTEASQQSRAPGCLRDYC